MINEPRRLINESKPLVEIDFTDTSFIKETVIERKRVVNLKIRLLIALVFLFQLFLAYTIMLIVMTFNLLLFFAPILGMTSGFVIINFTEEYLGKVYSVNRRSKFK